MTGMTPLVVLNGGVLRKKLFPTMGVISVDEPHSDPENAIKREKIMKTWKRAWKLQRIESINPRWNDLYEEITGN